jgi:hypothetical protein
MPPYNVSSLNIWDVAGQGNYWSDYNGTDSDWDGIGDKPHLIDDNNQDNYPLMEPVVIPEFSSWIILPLFLGSAFMMVFFKKKNGFGTNKCN